MKRQIAVVMYAAVFGVLMLSSHAVAQQKTAATCQEEWRANKAANQANGVTEKAYVANCRGGAAPPQTTAAPAAPSAAALAAQPASGQKTAKACRDEWRANKAANQASGVTESAYVAQCRGAAAPAQATAAPAAPPASVPAPTAAAAQAASGQKTAKACRDEWRANKSANQASGVTESAYVAQCRGGAAPAQTTAAPAAPSASVPAPSAAPAPTAAVPSSQPASPAPATKAAPTSAANPVGANEFSTEAQAKARCPTDTVVWVNLKSKVYHFSGTRNYGNTKSGAYMCERDTAAEGMRAAKNEKHP
jgi:hypothetical protein